MPRLGMGKLDAATIETLIATTNNRARAQFFEIRPRRSHRNRAARHARLGDLLNHRQLVRLHEDQVQVSFEEPRVDRGEYFHEQFLVACISSRNGWLCMPAR